MPRSAWSPRCATARNGETEEHRARRVVLDIARSHKGLQLALGVPRDPTDVELLRAIHEFGKASQLYSALRSAGCAPDAAVQFQDNVMVAAGIAPQRAEHRFHFQACCSWRRLCIGMLLLGAAAPWIAFVLSSSLLTMGWVKAECSIQGFSNRDGCSTDFCGLNVRIDDGQQRPNVFVMRHWEMPFRRDFYTGLGRPEFNAFKCCQQTPKTVPTCCELYDIDSDNFCDNWAHIAGCPSAPWPCKYRGGHASDEFGQPVISELVAYEPPSIWVFISVSGAFAGFLVLYWLLTVRLHDEPAADVHPNERLSKGKRRLRKSFEEEAKEQAEAAECRLPTTSSNVRSLAIGAPPSSPRATRTLVSSTTSFVYGQPSGRAEVVDVDLVAGNGPLGAMTTRKDGHVFVATVLEGLLKDWNNKNPDYAVTAGAEILSANGVSSKKRKVFEEALQNTSGAMQPGGLLRLSVRLAQPEESDYTPRGGLPLQRVPKEQPATLSRRSPKGAASCHAGCPAESSKKCTRSCEWCDGAGVWYSRSAGKDFAACQACHGTGREVVNPLVAGRDTFLR